MERKEAIEVIKKNWPDSSFTMLRKALETLIPELKDSEDERIRKLLIEAVIQVLQDQYCYNRGVSKEKVVAWLEKQVEHKPTNWLQELEDKLANATPKQLAEWKEKYFKEDIFWSEEVERIINRRLNLINGDYFDLNEETNGLTNEIIDTIELLQEEPVPQFKVGDTIRSKVWESAVHEIVFMDNSAYFFENGGMVRFTDQEQWELVEEPVSENLEEAAKKYSSCTYLEEVLSDDDKEVLKERLVNTFKSGAKWQKEQMIAKAIDVEVKVDAGGYPYIDKTIELYDYCEDVPLAKEGDKYKVILIKED